jgi:hypothetical protein
MPNSAKASKPFFAFSPVFFMFVALLVIGFGIGNRHRQTVCLQLPRPFRIALLMSTVVPTVKGHLLDNSS